MIVMLVELQYSPRTLEWCRIVNLAHARRGKKLMHWLEIIHLLGQIIREGIMQQVVNSVPIQQIFWRIAMSYKNKDVSHFLCCIIFLTQTYTGVILPFNFFQIWSTIKLCTLKNSQPLVYKRKKKKKSAEALQDLIRSGQLNNYSFLD